MYGLVAWYQSFAGAGREYSFHEGHRGSECSVSRLCETPWVRHASRRLVEVSVHALFFACGSDLDTSATLWGFDADALAKLNPRGEGDELDWLKTESKQIRTFEVREGTARQFAQLGLFTVAGCYRISHDKLLEQGLQPADMVRIPIAAGYKRTVLLLLASMGINRISLQYPSLDDCSRDIRRQYRPYPPDYESIPT